MMLRGFLRRVSAIIRCFFVSSGADRVSKGILVVISEMELEGSKVEPNGWQYGLKWSQKEPLRAKDLPKGPLDV